MFKPQSPQLHKNKYFLLIFSILLIGSISTISAYSSPFEFEVLTQKQGECFNIFESCDNCTYVNITILFQNGTPIIENEAMTNLSSYYYYNYSFCNTSSLGIYTIIYNYDDEYGLNSEIDFFEVTPSGTSFTNALSLPLFLPMILMLLITVFWFFLTGFTDRKEYKLTFILFGMLFMIFSIAFGIIASREVLYGFPLLYGFVNSFYKVFIVFASVGSIVISLIIMFHVIKTAFNTRGYNIGGKE